VEALNTARISSGALYYLESVAALPLVPAIVICTLGASIALAASPTMSRRASGQGDVANSLQIQAASTFASSTIAPTHIEPTHSVRH
jgi:hypothetical protein